MFLLQIIKSPKAMIFQCILTFVEQFYKSKIQMDFLQLLGSSSYNPPEFSKSSSEFKTNQSVINFIKDGDTQMNKKQLKSHDSHNDENKSHLGQIGNQFLLAFQMVFEKKLPIVNPYLSRIITKMQSTKNQKVRQQLGFFIYIFEKSGIFNFQKQPQDWRRNQIVKSNLKVNMSRRNLSLVRQIYKAVYSTLENSNQQIIQIINWKTLKVCEAMFSVKFTDYLADKGLYIQNYQQNYQKHSKVQEKRNKSTRNKQQQVRSKNAQLGQQQKQNTQNLIRKGIISNAKSLQRRKISIQRNSPTNKEYSNYKLKQQMNQKRKQLLLPIDDKLNFREIENIKIVSITPKRLVLKKPQSCHLIDTFNQKNLRQDKPNQIRQQLIKNNHRRQRSISENFYIVNQKLQQILIENQHQQIKKIKEKRQMKNYQNLYQKNRTRFQNHRMLVNRTTSQFFPSIVKQKMQLDKKKHISVSQKIIKVQKNLEANYSCQEPFQQKNTITQNYQAIFDNIKQQKKAKSLQKSMENHKNQRLKKMKYIKGKQKQKIVRQKLNKRLKL